jgi:hypothetical protein
MSNVIITGPGRYATKGGEVVTITQRRDDPDYPWLGVDEDGLGHTWAPDGDFYLNDKYDALDITGPTDEGPQPCKECDLPRHPTGRQLHELSDGTWKMVEVR